MKALLDSKVVIIIRVFFVLWNSFVVQRPLATIILNIMREDTYIFFLHSLSSLLLSSSSLLVFYSKIALPLDFASIFLIIECYGAFDLSCSLESCVDDIVLPVL